MIFTKLTVAELIGVEFKIMKHQMIWRYTCLSRGNQVISNSQDTLHVTGAAHEISPVCDNKAFVL